MLYIIKFFQIMKLILSLLFVIRTVSAVSFFDVVVQEWEEWKMLHGRNYDSQTEEKFRLKIFMENKAKIARHNMRASRGNHTFFLKMNHYGDMVIN